MEGQCPSLFQVRHCLHSIPVDNGINSAGIISGCYDDDFESSAAEMTDDSGSEVGEFGEGCEDGEESEAHSTEAEEVTDSLQCSSLENTLTSSHQVSSCLPAVTL